MKNLLILITIMLVGGCGKGKEAQTKTKVTEDNNATKPVKESRELIAQRVKELNLISQVVGEYEIKIDGDTGRVVLLKNGAAEAYTNGKKDEEEAKWSIIKEGEIHAVAEDGRIVVLRINVDGSLISIAVIKDKLRIEVPKELQLPLKKNQIVYFGSLSKKLYAIQTSFQGLASNPWPMPGQNPLHTGRVPK